MVSGIVVAQRHSAREAREEAVRQSRVTAREEKRVERRGESEAGVSATGRQSGGGEYVRRQVARGGGRVSAGGAGRRVGGSGWAGWLLG